MFIMRKRALARWIGVAALLMLETSASGLLTPGQAQADRVDRSITPADMVRHAYAEVERRHAMLRLAKDTRESLLRLQELDQAGRQVLGQAHINNLSEPQRTVAWASVWAVINRYDIECQRRLKLLMPPGGWFRASIVGKDGAKAAFLIVQHAVNDPQLMRSVAQIIALFVPEGEASGSSLALITDRIALEFDHKPQTYGTQVACVDGKWSATDVVNPEHLDERRRRVGLNAELDYLKNFDDAECPSVKPAGPIGR